MSFDIALRSHLLGMTSITDIVGSKIQQALHIEDKNQREDALPAIVFELDKETRNVKTNRVTATYFLTCAADKLADSNTLTELIYGELKDWTGKLNNDFPCAIEFVEIQRRYNKDLNYWLVMSKYQVGYQK